MRLRPCKNPGHKQADCCETSQLANINWDLKDDSCQFQENRPYHQAQDSNQRNVNEHFIRASGEIQQECKFFAHSVTSEDQILRRDWSIEMGAHHLVSGIYSELSRQLRPTTDVISTNIYKSVEAFHFHTLCNRIDEKN
ncbi:hypothetical protein TcWFU_002592 [Taenia crassiceps]|uniref:Uncharacterized protein n=1 Tax=Taenia crassiceps TaxID=6207 RepID=A0ABR4QPE5_9CEST